MKSKIVLCAALVCVVALVPTAAGSPDRAQRIEHAQTSQSAAGGVGTALAAELAKQGVHAAIAQWAPSLQKYTSPIEHGLAQVQAQLTEINTKLTQLIDHQVALEARLNCSIQRTALHSVLSDARAWFDTLRDQEHVVSLDSRKHNLEALFAERSRMLSVQNHLHTALIGSDGLIRACAQHIQQGFLPFLSADLANEVHNFYAVYHAAAVQLLVVRANMIALHPEQFPAGAAEHAAQTVQNWWTAEEGLIKPHFPNTMAYDTQTHWLWKTHVVQHGQTELRQTLRNEGWHVTGYTYVPECGAVEAEYKKSHHSGSAALEYFRKHYMLPPVDKIVCYDTHNQLFEFNLHTYHYAYAGEVQSFAPSLVAKPNNGLVNIEHFTY